MIEFKLYRSFLEMNNYSKWKGNYFVCLEFSFHDSSYYAAFSSSPHSIVYCFVANKEGEIINISFQKLHYPLEQEYGLKKIS